MKVSGSKSYGQFHFLLSRYLCPFVWAYYYITLVALIPVLLGRLSNAVCWIRLCIIFTLPQRPVQKMYDLIVDMLCAIQLASALAIMLLAVLFLFTLRAKAGK